MRQETSKNTAVESLLSKAGDFARHRQKNFPDPIGRYPTQPSMRQEVTTQVLKLKPAGYAHVEWWCMVGSCKPSDFSLSTWV